MKKLSVKSRKILFALSHLEKKHKIITYASLLFLTVSTYFLRTENQNVKVKYATLEEKSNGLKHNMVIFNRNYEGFPLPVWQEVKRGDKFVLQYVNDAFINQFGHRFDYNRYDIMGKSNFNYFPKQIARQYYENNIAAAITGEVIISTPEYIDKNDSIHKMKVIKWREIRDRKDTLVYGMVKEIMK